MAKIILCRHGFTPANNVGWNKQKGIDETFYYDEFCPLDETYGVKQVDELGEFLAGELQGKKVMVYLSPYYRTRQTASHIFSKIGDECSSIDIMEVPAIREINQGLNYARLKEEDDYEAELRKGPNKVGISYRQGESEVEARRRVRRFSNKLVDYMQTGETEGEAYDVVLVVTHETIMHSIMYNMYGKEDGLKILTAGAVEIEGEPKVIFAPETSVPKGYKVKLEDYKDYFRLRSFYDLMFELKQDEKFQAFLGKRIELPLAEETVTFEKSGETLTILPGNTDKKGFFLIDSSLGQDAYAYDKKSTSTYYVLDGEGEFDINGAKLKVKKGDIVTIPPKTVFYYKGKMKLIEKMTPNFQAENVVEVKKVKYSKQPTYDFIPKFKDETPQNQPD